MIKKEVQLEIEYPDEVLEGPTELMAELCQAIDRFNDYWPSLFVDATVFRIPFYEDGKVPEVVEVEKVTGKEAVKLCVSAFRGFSRQPQVQNPGTVYRLPGCIVLDRVLQDEIAEINSMKLKLKKMIKERYPNQKARSAFCRATFPGRVMLQVYRKIYTADSAIARVRFSWSPGTHAITPLKRRDAIELLRNRLESGIDVGEQKDALQIAIANVHALGKNKEIICERPRAPHPVASFMHTTGRDNIKRMVPLSLPIFVGPGLDGEPVDVGELALHDSNVRKQARSDRRESKPLFNPLCLRYRTRGNPKKSKLATVS